MPEFKSFSIDEERINRQQKSSETIVSMPKFFMIDQPPTNNAQESEAVKNAREAAKIAEYKAAQAKFEAELAAQLRAKLAGEKPADKPTTAALEITRLKEEKELATAQIEKLKAQFLPIPASPDLKAPTGGVTVTSDPAGGFVEVEILGQQATRKVAKLLTNDLAQLFDDLNKNPNGSYKNPQVDGALIIYNLADITALSVYSAVFQELEGFNLEFVQNRANAGDKIAAAKNALNPPAATTEQPPNAAETAMDMGLTAVLAAPAIATGIVKSIAELVSLFRTDTEIKNKTLTVAEDFIVSCLAKNLPYITVYYPSLYPPMLPDDGEKTKFVVILRAVRANAHAARGEMKQVDSVIERVVAAQNETQTALASKKSEITANEVALNAETDAAKRAALETELQKLRGEQSALESRRSLSQTLADLNEAKDKLNFLVTTAAEVLGGLDAPDATTKTTPLVKLLGIARLHELINKPGTYTLRFTTTANGATTIRKKFYWWNTEVLHTAGANLVYQLFDKQGRIAQANTFQAYLDSKTSAEVLAKTDLAEQKKNLDDAANLEKNERNSPA